MQVHFGIEPMRPEWKSSVVCVGTFDGIHLGHREVILSAVRQAASLEIPCVVVTFDRHPSAILAPDRKPAAISSLEDNLDQFAALGAAVCVVLPFDKDLSETPAQLFLDKLLKGALKACYLVVGHDFAFGRGREGDGLWLQQRIETTVVPPLSLDGARVSSSAIREAIRSGDVATAARLLGRPFRLHGVVVGGRKLGRTIGYPTLNLARSFEQVLPSEGIYAGRCRTLTGVFASAISIGHNPTVEMGLPQTIEAYLIDYPGDSLYGADVSLEFCKKLRDQEKFDSLETMKQQIARDVDIAAKQMASTYGT